ncbi:homeobox-leucine zipper protein ROC8-like [Gastrolobium bilobum]|uniref:homeobox-leucine zipper protein ROC8-like n=1 Tax=Gastrolobium bilobum TaxID=150636 RepID=UPI002AB02A2F|nr:homeobox-leucine zipper protein ROC8-like [Gastrolobium bilobum]
MKNIHCNSCGGPHIHDHEEHELVMQKLRLENAQLKDEHEKLCNLIGRYKEEPQPELQEAHFPFTGSSTDPDLGCLLNQPVEYGSSSHDQNHGAPIMDDDILLPNSTMECADIEKALMLEVATAAMDELVKLLRINEPLWVRSSTLDGKCTLHHETYERLFPRTNHHFRGANVFVESSKDSGIVSIRGTQLVDMILDSEKFVNLFPTIVTKADTIKVFESGMLGNQSGALQLMHEEIHILSPLVRSREFHFLRYCQQIGVGIWVIVDVSFDLFRQDTPLSRSWRHPSGCMIEEMPNGCSMVTWVEHVEVDDRIHTHRLYRDIVGTNIAYGAHRWIMELQRMGERFAFFYAENMHNYESGGVINSLEGRKSVMKLSHRMVKHFCESLNMSGKLDFPHLTVENNTGVRVAVHKLTELGQPNGLAVAAATSLWLPLHHHKVFDFLTDDRKRAQWDILSNGKPMNKVAQITSGIYPGNCVSIIRPFIPNENNMLLLQESFTNPMGSYFVYAPIDVAQMNRIIKDERDCSVFPILPSGFVISPDGKPNAIFNNGNVDGSGGSLLTMAFQVLICGPGGSLLFNMENVANVNALLTSTVQKIKEAFNCNTLE